MKSLRTRTLATVPVVALALTLLAGCSTADEGGGIGADGCALPGNKSDSVRVSGDFGTDLSLDSSVEAKGFQRTVMQQGEGEAVADGLTFAGRINVFVGNNRELYVQEPTKHVLDSAQLAPWFYNTVKCSNEGDRVASVFPAVDLLGPGGGESMGIADDDTMVVVVDVRTVLSAGAGRAVGAEQPLPEGFPAVALDEDGVHRGRGDRGLPPRRAGHRGHRDLRAERRGAERRQDRGGGAGYRGQSDRARALPQHGCPHRNPH